MTPPPSSIAEQLERLLRRRRECNEQYCTDMHARLFLEAMEINDCLLSVIKRQNEALAFYGDGFGYEQEIDNGEKAAEALREAAPIIAVMEKMK